MTQDTHGNNDCNNDCNNVRSNARDNAPNRKNRRVLILGAGAVGLSFAGKISENCEVFVVCRNRHATAIKNRGLVMKGVWGDRTVRDIAVFSSYEELSAAIAAESEGAGKMSDGVAGENGVSGENDGSGAGCVFDYVFITSKSSDTEGLCREYSPMFGGAVLVSLQNGIGNEEIMRKYTGESAVFGATITTNFQSEGDGCVTVKSESEPLKIGVYPENGSAGAGSLEKLADIVAIIERSGIKVEAADSIRTAIWEKSLLNIAVNPLTALFRVNVGALSDEQTRAVITGIINETFEVIAAEGVKVRWETAAEYLDYLFNYLIPSFSAVYTSMYQDVTGGRHSEIESINGAVVRLGKIHGIKTPYNECICRLIRFTDAKNDKNRG